MSGPRTFGTPAYIGQLLLTRFLLVFEVASFLLLIAAVGGVVLAAPPRRHRRGRRAPALDAARRRAPAGHRRTTAEGVGTRVGVGAERTGGGAVSIAWYLAVSAIVFSLGALGVMTRRNPLVVLLCLELMLNGANLALVAFSRMWGNGDGQILALIVMTVAACEVCIGLGMIVAIYRRHLPIDVDETAGSFKADHETRMPAHGIGVLSRSRAKHATLLASLSGLACVPMGARWKGHRHREHDDLRLAGAAVPAARHADHGVRLPRAAGHAAGLARHGRDLPCVPGGARRADRRCRATPPAHRQLVSSLWSYASTAGIDARMSILVDPLSVFMILVVSGVSTLIHLYSISYMEKDRGFARYFSYLNFFVFSMLLLVLAGNFLLLIVGWAFVGAASYLLISFWYRRTTATKAGIKAFVINVVGDVGLVLGDVLHLQAHRHARLREELPRG